jgi:hypothetical protein
MILQAERSDSRQLIGEATCIGKLAAAVALQATSMGTLPRVVVFDSNGDDILLRDHDTITAPIRCRIYEHADYWKRSLPLMHQVAFADKLAGAFGFKRVGPRAILAGWRHYLEAANP